MNTTRSFPGFATPGSVTIDLTQGMYEVAVALREATLPGFFTLESDGLEIGSGAVPARNNPQGTQRIAPPGPQWHANDRQKHLELVRNWNPPDTFKASVLTLHTWVFPLYRDRQGTVVLTCRAHSSCLNDEVMRFCADSITVEVMTVRPVPVSSVEQKIPDALMHRPLVPIWGWMSMTSFDHPDRAVSTPRELRTRAIDESAAWGATGFEFLPVNEDGLCFEPAFTTEEAEGSSSAWPVSSDPTWTASEARELLQHARSRGMANFLFLYTLYGLSTLRAGTDHQEREQLLRAILTTLHADRLLTGVILEGWLPVEPSRILPLLHDYGAQTALFVSVESGEQIDARDLAFSHEVYPYIAHWATFSVQHTGFDHSYPHAPFPMSWYREIMGPPCFYMQGCAQTHHPRKRFPRISPDCSIGVSNRTVSPDWIAAQIVSFSEMNLLHPDEMPAAAVCWEADEPTMAPEPARRYMYALSQDPYRACYACRLEDTGSGGEIDLKRETRRIRPEETLRLRRRHPYPATSTVLRNRFLEILFFTDRDYSVLRADLTGRGRYYHNGACTVTADPVWVTRFGDLRELVKTIHLTEPAGPLSVVTESVSLGGSEARCTENRRWTLLAECSAFSLQLCRQWDSIPRGSARTVESFIGLRGRTMHVIRADEMSQVVELNDATGSGLPPCTLTIAWDGSVDQVQVRHEHDGVLIRHRVIGEAETWTISVESGLSQLRPVVETVACADETINLDHAPAVLRVRGAPHRSVYVRAGNIWRARPSALSAEHPDELLLRLGDCAPGPVELRFEDYLYSWLRAADGCRYVVDFSSVNVSDEHAEALVLVSSVPKFVKKVHIESSFPLADARINGKDCELHEDGHVLFVPAAVGVYTLRVRR
ncbi:MAG: hypothetical protein EA383_10555 [Spirochaetaceae bacterium]|nr:MAG: hypothetical protein EA383_10555 [Spirochaetaceae bacterium]